MTRWGTGRAALRATWLLTQATARVSTGLARRPVARLWFTVWRGGQGEAAAQREATWLAGTERLTIPFQGGTLAGFAAGTGPAVLLVHGWGDRATRLGAFIRPLVDAGFRVVGVDLPAHGDSAGHRTNVFELALALRATADAVGGVDAVVAHSLGGAAAVRALGDGLDVRSVALVAPAVRLDHVLNRFESMFGLSPRAVIALRIEIRRRFGGRVWADLAADRTAAALRTPALIVHDRSDPQIDVADAEMLAAAWPTARLIVTEGLGHQRIVRDEQVVSEIVTFLSMTMAAPHGERALRALTS
jgi:pimeloyl-ACP methyl ester carboxylesterase